MSSNAPAAFIDLPAAVSAQQEQTRRLVRAMMALTGLSASALARATGLTPSTLNRFMHQPVRHTLSQRTLLALMVATFRIMREKGVAALDAGALSVLAPTLPTFEHAILEQIPDAERILKEIKLRTGAGLGTLARPQIQESTQNLPVITATTNGIDVAASNFDKAPLTSQRPSFLADEPHAFAYLVTENTMSPRYDTGDLLYVSPARDTEGDNVDVIVDKKQGSFILARLIQTTDKALVLLKLQSQESFEIPRDSIRGIYRVVGVRRLGA